MRRFRALLTALLLVGAPLPKTSARAQSEAADTPYTLHVYEDLLQIPTLVLDADQRSAAGLTPDRFTISLDSGPPFHPQEARIEGDDPIELALAFDLGDSTAGQAARLLEAALEQAASLGLTSRDDVSVYASHCELVRSGPMIRFSQAVLRQQLEVTLSAMPLRDASYVSKPCPLHLRTWDVLGSEIHRMESLPKRRVIYLFSRGQDAGSTSSWQAVAEFADSNDVTIIGFRSGFERHVLQYGVPQRQQEDPFQFLCSETGGTVLPLRTNDAVEQMTRATSLLRSRYILEFARPRSGAAGIHDIFVQTEDPRLHALPSGISFPPRNASGFPNVDVAPSEPSQAPVLGSRRVLTPTH